MQDLKRTTARWLELFGALVENLEPDGLEVMPPDGLRERLDWPELVRLGFGPQLPPGALRVGLEGDWLQRISETLGERGAWLRLRLPFAGAAPDGERLLAQAISTPNAVVRLLGLERQWSRCLAVCVRYRAVSDEKQEGLLWLAANLGTATLVPDLFARLTARLPDFAAAPPLDPDDTAPPAALPAPLQRRIAAAIETTVRLRLGTFLQAMDRRAQRDGQRIHDYHNDLYAATARHENRRPGIEREYAAKLDDLRHRYAVHVSCECVQAVEMVAPVDRLSLQILRRKGKRELCLDWHPALRLLDLPVCDWGAGLDRVRLACDQALHLVPPEGLADCVQCLKPWCRACHAHCPRCPVRAPASAE